MFGPPQNFTSASSCSWLGHPVSGLQHATSFLRPFQTRFRYGSGTSYLNLQHIVTRRPVLQKVRNHTGIATVVLSLLVSLWFQVLFHSPPGVLFTFPSRYCFSIGHQVVFSLRRWASRLPTGFLVSDGTLDTHRFDSVSPTGLSPSFAALSSAVRLLHLLLP